MSLSGRTPTTAGTNKFVPAIYENRVVDAAKKELVAWDAISSEWHSSLVKGDTLYIPKSNHVTGTEVVVGAKGSALKSSKHHSRDS